MFPSPYEMMPGRIIPQPLVAVPLVRQPVRFVAHHLGLPTTPPRGGYYAPVLVPAAVPRSVYAVPNGMYAAPNGMYVVPGAPVDMQNGAFMHYGSPPRRA